MRETKCDRCGKAVDARMAKTLIRRHRYGETLFDLCEECYQEFKTGFLTHYAKRLSEEQDE